MNFLFVHQNFPGQYRQLVQWLARRKEHRIVALTQRTDVPETTGNVSVVSYKAHHKPGKDAYALSRYYEECMGAAFGVALACKNIKDKGFTPDIIIGHVGWGELTFVKEIWPDVPVIGYWEYFFLAKGGCVGFDDEFPVNENTPFIMHARNATNYLNLATCDLGQCPTRWQMNTYPVEFRRKSYVCHDGIRTDVLKPNPDSSLSLARLERAVTREDEIFTYMARNMEPVRGFHIFMRSLPRILSERPNARVLIIGGNEVSYGQDSNTPGGYRADLEKEVGKDLDWSRVHFLGKVPYADYQRIIQLSRCHIYLTVPFVLSWSLLETMSMQATIVASGTAPVREVITHGKNGLLVDFLKPDELASQVIEVLSHPDDYTHLGPAARAHVVRKYDFLTKTLKVHLSKVNSLVPKKKRLVLKGL